MKQTTSRATSAARGTSKRASSQPPQAAPTKSWSVKVELRLPHKIGQPLGSNSSDGCGA